MLLDVIRKIMPINTRQDLGLWTAKQAGRSKFLVYPYFWMLCGEIPKNLRLLPDDDCSVTYKGINVVAPRDGILAFIEVFQQDTYEKYWAPKPTDIVVDVGAYVGMFTVKFASQVGQVVAIEPCSSNYRYLVQNTAYLENVSCVSKAASDVQGKTNLYLSNATACHTLNDRHNNYEVVEADTLDNIILGLGLDHVDFIKIDAEGAELKILKGAEGLLKGNVKLAIASYHNMEDGKPEKPEIVRFLGERGLSLKNNGEYIYAEHICVP